MWCEYVSVRMQWLTFVPSTDTERGTPAPGEAAARPAVDDDDREATPVAPVASSSPITRSASKGKGRAL